MAWEGAASTLDALPLGTNLDSEARAGIVPAVAIASRQSEQRRVRSSRAAFMGNLGTDIPPSEETMEATRAASLFTVSPTQGRVT